MRGMRGFGTIVTIILLATPVAAWASYGDAPAVLALWSAALGFGFGRIWERHVRTPSSGPLRATAGAARPRR